MVKQTTFQTTPGDQAPQATQVQTSGLVTLPDATNTQLLAANTSRRFVLIVNETAATIYVKMGTTATTSHIPVEPGNRLEVEPDAQGWIYTGRIDAIQSSGGPVNLFVHEEEQP